MISSVECQVQQGAGGHLIDLLDPSCTALGSLSDKASKERESSRSATSMRSKKRHPDWGGEKVLTARSTPTSCRIAPLAIAARTDYRAGPSRVPGLSPWIRRVSPQAGDRGQVTLIRLSVVPIWMVATARSIGAARKYRTGRSTPFQPRRHSWERNTRRIGRSRGCSSHSVRTAWTYWTSLGQFSR